MNNHDLIKQRRRYAVMWAEAAEETPDLLEAFRLEERVTCTRNRARELEMLSSGLNETCGETTRIEARKTGGVG